MGRPYFALRQHQKEIRMNQSVKNVLVIDGSATPEGSVSRLLVEDLVARLRQGPPLTTLVRRNVGAKPLPHLSPANFAGLRGVPSSDDERSLRELSDVLIAE